MNHLQKLSGVLKELKCAFHFNMSTKDKWVRRFSVDETAKHKNGFTIYKITSVVRIYYTITVY